MLFKFYNAFNMICLDFRYDYMLAFIYTHNILNIMVASLRSKIKYPYSEIIKLLNNRLSEFNNLI